MAEYFRIVVGELGIYEAVDRDCPRSDARRENKPDGSWLPKVGANYPGAISFWTGYGLKYYMTSGLLEWHVSVIQDQPIVLIAENLTDILYHDEYQVICNLDQTKIKSRKNLKDFLERQTL